MPEVQQIADDMNTGTIIALFVSILGSFLILSGVFLVYKWRAGNAIRLGSSTHSVRSVRSGRSIIDQEAGSPEMQQYRVRHGRIVPKAQTQSVISTRSGWQTLKHATIVFDDAKTASKVDNASIRTVDVRGKNRRQPSIASSMSSVPPPQEWRQKLSEIRTPQSSEHPKNAPGRPPPLSLAVPSSRSFRRGSKRSLRSPRSPRDPPMCVLHEVIHELETPPTDLSTVPSNTPSNPFNSPRESRKSSNASGTFLHSPTQSMHDMPTLSTPKRVYLPTPSRRDSKMSELTSPAPTSASFTIDAGVC